MHRSREKLLAVDRIRGAYWTEILVSINTYLLINKYQVLIRCVDKHVIHCIELKQCNLSYIDMRLI